MCEEARNLKVLVFTKSWHQKVYSSHNSIEKG